MEFRAAIQGHYQILDEKNRDLRRSLAASRNYFDYKISDGNGNVDGRLGIKLGLPDVEVIEQFKSYIRPTTPQASPIGNRQAYQKAVLTNTRAQSKSPRRGQRKTTMSQAIPSFLSSRLEAISNQLGLAESKTIEELFKWTEVGISLAKELNLDELDPNAVFDSVQSLRQMSDSSSDRQSEFNHDDSIELAAAKQQIAALIDSQLSMSKAIEKLANHRRDNSADSNSARIRNNQNQTAASDTANSSQQLYNNSSTTTNRKRDRPDTVREDIHQAIDAIIEFNDDPGRPHNQKFYLGVGSIKELSGRGDVAIRKILHERADEIQQHLAQHELDQNHNLSRRDAQGFEYPKIDDEQSINYRKITEVP
jgi:ribosomal protein S15P/S13E